MCTWTPQSELLTFTIAENILQRTPHGGFHLQLMLSIFRVSLRPSCKVICSGHFEPRVVAASVHLHSCRTSQTVAFSEQLSRESHSADRFDVPAR